MGGSTGLRAAASQEPPDAVAVMDPSQVTGLAGGALGQCRRQTQRDMSGRRGRKNDPLRKARRALHASAGLATNKQQAPLEALLAEGQRAGAQAAWGTYQQTATACQGPSPGPEELLRQPVTGCLTSGAPALLVEPGRLGRALGQHATGALALLAHPTTSNAPTKAANEHLEHLRGPTLGPQSPTSHNARPLLKTDGLRPQPHPRSR